jgi:hypothetical protein
MNEPAGLGLHWPHGWSLLQTADLRLNIYKSRHEWVCNQHGPRPACGSVQSDQDQCCSLSVSLLAIGLVSELHGS